MNTDHDTPLLLPPDLRDWVPEDHLVHFIMEAVGLLDLSTAHVNHRGTGSDQYPPSMLLGLLLYCSATGAFSSRRIERLTHENVAVRLLCADRYPDHDSICTFRRENRALLESSFHQVLEVAARLRASAPPRLRASAPARAARGRGDAGVGRDEDSRQREPAQRGEPRPCAQVNGAAGGANRRTARQGGRRWRTG